MIIMLIICVTTGCQSMCAIAVYLLRLDVVILLQLIVVMFV